MASVDRCLTEEAGAKCLGISSIGIEAGLVCPSDIGQLTGANRVRLDFRQCLL